jgi:hypothetical protein
MSRRSFAGLKAVAAIAATLACATSLAAEVLIRPEEARLPQDPFIERSPFPGPKVTLEFPKGATRSPLRLKLKFETRGAKIDLGSLTMIYRKQPSVDLTPRVKDFAGPNGIDMANAEVPAGVHRIKVEVKDADGLVGGTEFTLNILK